MYACYLHRKSLRWNLLSQKSVLKEHLDFVLKVLNFIWFYMALIFSAWLLICIACTFTSNVLVTAKKDVSISRQHTHIYIYIYIYIYIGIYSWSNYLQIGIYSWSYTTADLACSTYISDVRTTIQISNAKLWWFGHVQIRVIFLLSPVSLFDIACCWGRNGYDDDGMGMAWTSKSPTRSLISYNYIGIFWLRSI